MKERPDNNNFSRHKRCKKSKRRTLHGSIKLFLVLNCCLTVMMFAIGLFANDFPFTIDKQPNDPLSTNAVTNTDFNTSSTADVQGNDAVTNTDFNTDSINDSQNNADETAWC